MSFPCWLTSNLPRNLTSSLLLKLESLPTQILWTAPGSWKILCSRLFQKLMDPTVRAMSTHYDHIPFDPYEPIVCFLTSTMLLPRQTTARHVRVVPALWHFLRMRKCWQSPLVHRPIPD